MNKSGKVLSVILVLAFFIFLGRSCYQVLCISCTPDPVKTYNYPGSMDELENHFKSYAVANPDIYYKISRRGPGSIDARDIIIKLRRQDNSIESHLVIYDFNGSTKLDIEEIFDQSHKNGGRNADDKKVKELLTEFENSFLTRFKKNEKIEFKRRFFNF